MVLRVYGVIPAQTSLPEDLAGAPATRLIVHGDLAAIVSDMDADRPAGREDLLAHAHVLEACAEDLTVIPFKFGIALADDEEVIERILGEQREVLVDLLRFFDGTQQVTLQASLDQDAALAEVLRRRPDLAAARSNVLGADSDSFDARVEFGRAVAMECEAVCADEKETLLGRLSPMALAVSEMDSTGEFEVLHAAFLVQRTERPQLDEVVGQLRRAEGDRLRLRYVGPQPPYSFLDAAQRGELAWA